LFIIKEAGDTCLFIIKEAGDTYGLKVGY